MSSNRVLLINHAFPPQGTVNTHRITKFAKYLPHYSWEPYVLTADIQSPPNKNSSIEVPAGVKDVRRTSFMLNNISIVNDGGLRWVLNVAREAKKMIEKYNIDVVFHSGPAFIPFSAIAWVKKKTNIPYIVDFRDPWMIMNHRNSNRSIKRYIHDRLSSHLEPFVFTKADQIVLNNDRMYEEYSTKYPDTTKKMNVIYNGFDPDDFVDLEPYEKNGFNLIYPGKFRDNMKYFFEGFCEFIKDRPDASFIHYGRKNIGYAPDVQEVINDLNLSEYVEFRGYTDRQTVFEEILGAQLGIAVTRPKDSTHVPAKIFDYMACDTPILCVDESSGASFSLLSQFERAYTIPRGDSNSVYDVLSDIASRGIDTLDQLYLCNKYNRKRQAGELASVLSSTL